MVGRATLQARAGIAITKRISLIQIDDDARLFISPAINDFEPLAAHEIDTIIDLEGGLDHCIPTAPGQCLYIYFPIYDEELPNLARLDALTTLGATLIRSGPPGNRAAKT